MLPPRHRLRDKKIIDHIFRRGQSQAAGDLIIKYSRAPTSPGRVAVIVGKKLARKATARNRIRRRLREAARLSAVVIPAGRDLLIVARNPKLADKPFPLLTQLVSDSLRKTCL